jgi:hypothetical protein
MGLFCAGYFLDEGSKSVGSISQFEGNHMKFPIKGSHFQNEGEVSENIF